jgi:hypothetical protein
VFVIQAPDQARSYWQRVTEMLRKQFPAAVPIMVAARDDVLAFPPVPQEYWRKIWSPNPLVRLNVTPRGALGNPVHQTPHQRGMAAGAPALLPWATMSKSPGIQEPLELTDVCALFTLQTGSQDLLRHTTRRGATEVVRAP